MSRIIDLTYTLNTDILVWPNERRPVYEWLERANTGSANVTYMSMSTHTGTHIDAPSHVIDEGETVDRVPLGYFWGKAKMFEIEDTLQGREVPRSALEKSGFDLGDATIFVMRTKVERYAGVRQYNTEYAYPSIDLLGWLMERGMLCYMTDAPSIDPYREKENLRHVCVFEKGCPVVENLRNLSLLPSDAYFTLCAMPLALPGRDGSPCRAAAWLD